MSEVIEKESTELVTLPPKETALQVFTDTEKLDEILGTVRAKVVGTVYDMDKRKDREACASDAYKVARSKTAMEKLGAAVSAELKELPKKVDAGRRYLKEGLEAIQAEVRAPLDEWEAAENARIAKHKAGIEWFHLRADEDRDLDSAELRASIEEVGARVVDETWEEFEAEAHRMKARALDSLTAALAAREKYEAEQAELAELRRKQAEQEQKDREAEIARQAAEKAKADAEAKAQAEREAAAKREAEAKAAAEKAERDRQEAIERQKQAEARAEAEKLAAEQRAKDAAEAARLAEIRRQADEKAAAEAEQRKREADQQHRIKIMGEAKQAFMGMNITEELARSIVLKIARGEVPHVTINF
ncbi:hypothetical protein [Paracandidimonas soli]|uniref:Uncharacterized protein n=1 Tax=Paracandidimonas soli TaxID=1917182 RepID=A0A4R3UPJ9_9BURK|nr:hypothetical protein [Paracandidimonas soli]TCU92570.1 hypothetical protein EV686_1147 [Paracandidimonas soli]